MGKRLHLNPFQFRRGVGAENDAYIGAAGELTYDITAKSVRAHDGETAGGTLLAAAAHSHQSDLRPIAEEIEALQAALAGLAEQVANMPGAAGAPPDDYIVAKSAPGANPWYRRWNSGWVEQGGTTSQLSGTADGVTIDLPETMHDTNYQTMTSVTATNSTTSNVFGCKEVLGRRTTSSFNVITNSSSGGAVAYLAANDGKINWLVCGKAA